MSIRKEHRIAKDNQCLTADNDYTCSDPHYEGSYCEVPVDYCGTLDATACAAESLCEYANLPQYCVYSDCYTFTTEEECEGTNGTKNYMVMERC